MDLHSRHQALNTLLSAAGGESRVAAYWSVIELFLRAQLSKSELDAEVKRLVGEEHIAAHNDFFFALLQNAMSDELPSAAKAKREGREADGTAGSAGKADKGEKAVKREGAEVTSKEGQRGEGKEGKKDKEKGKEAKKDKSGLPLPVTPTAASAASLTAAAVKSEDKKEGKKRLKEGRRDKRKERHEEEEAMDWTEQAWPLPSPPQRWSDVSQASVHREMKHVVTASDYFATLRRERERRGVGREGDGEEGGKEGGEWLWAIEESKIGYLRVRSAEDDGDDSRASVNHAVALIRSRARSKRNETEERKEDNVGSKGEREGSDVEEKDRPPAWLNPASSAAYRTSPLSLPAMPALRARCLLTAKHGGLKTISEGALGLIHQAMCQYVRMLLAEMIADKARSTVQPSPPSSAPKSENADSRVEDAMEVEPAASPSASSHPSGESSSSPAAHFSSFPSSCFAPSLFSPLPSDSSLDTSDHADKDKVSDADSMSLIREVPSADTTSTPLVPSADTGGTSGEASTAVKMETDASAVPPNAADTSVSVAAPDTQVAPLSFAPSAASVRSLSVSVPLSPPSLESSMTAPATPSTLLAERPRRAEEEKAKEAEDDARTPFPFLIARQPAYRPPPAPSQALSQAAPMTASAAQPAAAVSVQRSDGVSGGLSLLSAGAMSLSDFLDCLRDRRSSSMRVADDLPFLLERLIIVQ